MSETRSGLVFHTPEHTSARDARILGAVTNATVTPNSAPELGTAIAVPFGFDMELDAAGNSAVLRSAIYSAFEELEIPRRTNELSNRRLDFIRVHSPREGELYKQTDVLEHYLGIDREPLPRKVPRIVNWGRASGAFTSNNVQAWDNPVLEMAKATAEARGIDHSGYRMRDKIKSRTIDIPRSQVTVRDTFSVEADLPNRPETQFYTDSSATYATMIGLSYDLTTSQELIDRVKRARSVASQEASAKSQRHYDELAPGDEVVDGVWLDGGYQPDNQVAESLVSNIDLISEKEWRARVK